MATFTRITKDALETLKRELTLFDAYELEVAVRNLEVVDAASEQAVDRYATTTELVVLRVNNIEIKAEKTLIAAERAITLLTYLSTLSNNSQESATREGHTRSKGPRNENRKQELCKPVWTYSESPIDVLFSNKGEVNLSGSFEEKDEQKLRAFSSSIAGIVRKAQPIKRLSKDASMKDKADYKTKVQDTVNAILNYNVGETDVGDERSLYIPIPPGQEVGAVQPILSALVRVMANLVEESRIAKQNPFPAKDVQKERYIEPPDRRSKWRKVDLVFSKDGKSFPFELRSLLSLTEEIKLLRLFEFLSEGMDQQLGHQAKRLLYAFDFGGVGVDAYCTGIVMTMASIEVVQVCFERDSFEIKLRSTGKLPLLPNDCVKKLLQWDCSENEKEEIKLFLDELFPSDKSSNDASDIPKGLVTLWKLLNTPSRELFKDYWDDGKYTASGDDSSRYEVDDRLGSGTFGEVYSVKNEKQYVIKVVKSGQSPAIEVEIDVLKRLSENGNGSEHIPTFKSEGTLCVSIRNQLVQLPAMMTSPKGGLNTRDLCMGVNFAWSEICTVAENVLSALLYAHSKGLCHLDVRPSNIVQVPGDPTRYLLVDWGCSRKMGKKVEGFIGSENYAHDHIHAMDAEMRSWIPRAEFDKASLLYTLVALFKNGRVPWKHDAGTELTKSRKKKVDGIIEKWELKNLQDLKNSADWKES